MTETQDTDIRHSEKDGNLRGLIATVDTRHSKKGVVIATETHDTARRTVISP